MTTFLTVREAALRVGKSPSSIRRAIYPILHDDKHADRGQIQPSVDEALALRTKGESFPWRVSEELLARTVRVETGHEQGSAGPSPRSPYGHGDGALLDMLRRELDIKNQQIARNDETVKSLNATIISLSERLRETNILIGSMQQRLGLTDGRDPKPSEPVRTKTIHPTKPEKGTGVPPKAAKANKAAAAPAKTDKPKRRLFSGWFR